MNVLLVGGSGRVGTMITPYLQRKHQLRVLDLRAPRHEGVEYVEGSVTDEAAVRRALEGVDTFVWLVMQVPQGGGVTDQDVPTIQKSYEVNTKGLHLFLWLAQSMGITRGVYSSTMSVHYRLGRYYHAEEQVPLDTPSVYGLTKALGEHICAYFARWFDMNLIGLRLNGPRERDNWLRERRAPPVYTNGYRLYPTEEEDLAEAYARALAAVQIGHARFDAVYVAGDETEEQHNLTKGTLLLGWEPRAQRLLEGDA